jgi:hypothetical protein
MKSFSAIISGIGCTLVEGQQVRGAWWVSRVAEAD